MPTGIYKRTEKSRTNAKGSKWSLESRHNFSLFKLGKPRNGNPKNWKHTKESREKMKTSQKLRNQKIPVWNKGKNTGRLSVEHRKKISESLRGIKSPYWQGGITPINTKIRNNIEFRLWREAVFARDNWTCQKTGIKGCYLHCHHIQNFSQYPELRFAIDNGITLSKEAHKEFHKKYGKQNNTREQLEEFLNRKL